jgi:alpha-beta hydrolase superfamily lysophospholipase
LDSLTVQEETVEDALAAVALLRGMQEINSTKVFVLGHSLGGMVIPRIGARDQSIAGFILLAAPSRPLGDILLDQSAYILSLQDTISEMKKTAFEMLKQFVSRMRDPNLTNVPSSQLPLGIPVRYWVDLREYHPAEAAKALKQPMLILQGERDYQVTAKDFQGWKDALSSRSNVTFNLYPNLNHLFVEGETKSTPVEYQRPGHVAETVIRDIVEWIRSR